MTGTTNAAVLKNSLFVRWPRGKIAVAITFGTCVIPPVLAMLPGVVTFNGAPVSASASVLSCHPPKNAFAQPGALAETAGQAGDPIRVLPVLFHQLWLGRLTGDLSRPLGYGTILTAAADPLEET